MIHIHAIKTLGRNDERAELRALPAPDWFRHQNSIHIVRLYNNEDHIIDLEQATNQVLGLNDDKETKVFYWYKVGPEYWYKADPESDFHYSAFIAVDSFGSANHEWAKQEARHRRWSSVGVCTR